jgi:hypothetical protein
MALGLANTLLGQTSPNQNPFGDQPLMPTGQNVIPVYDGWFQNADGSYSLCFGFFNMNTRQTLDIPLGADNQIEPAPFDGLQPTHFDPVSARFQGRPYRHQWCVFSVQVPRNFGDEKITWSLTSQGNELSVTGSLIPVYALNEPLSSALGEVAPFLSLDDDVPFQRGRRGFVEGPRKVRVGEPLSLLARVRHPDAGTWLGWSLHQGTANVRFSAPEVRLDVAKGVYTSVAVFSQPGNYVLRIQAINDVASRTSPTNGLEFHCCWSNAYLQVNVAE